jgi:hypothetical protein
MNWTLILTILDDVHEVMAALTPIFTKSQTPSTPNLIQHAVALTLDQHAANKLSNKTKDDIAALKTHLTAALTALHHATTTTTT